MRVLSLGPLPLVLLLGAGAASCKAYDGRPAEWEYISAVILEPNCATASCHSRGAAVAGLDFSDAERAYISLTRLRYQIVDRFATGETCSPAHETVVCRGSYRPLVMPYNPEQSRLVHILRNKTPPRMPPDRPLFEADVQLIEGWILLGATRGASPPVAGGPADGGPGDGGAADAGAADGAGSGDAASPSDARDALDGGRDLEPPVPNSVAERG
jgi:hypothetical protein